MPGVTLKVTNMSDPTWWVGLLEGDIAMTATGVRAGRFPSDRVRLISKEEDKLKENGDVKNVRSSKTLTKSEIEQQDSSPSKKYESEQSNDSPTKHPEISPDKIWTKSPESDTDLKRSETSDKKKSNFKQSEKEVDIKKSDTSERRKSDIKKSDIKKSEIGKNKYHHEISQAK